MGTGVCCFGSEAVGGGHEADHTPPNMASLGGGPAGQLSRMTSCKWHQNITGVVRNLVLVNSGYPHAKNFSKNYLQFGHAPSKTFTIPFLDWKILKNIVFKEPNFWPAHGAHMSQSPDSAVVAVLIAIMLKLDVNVVT